MGDTWQQPKSLTPLRPVTAQHPGQSGWVFYHGTPDERTWQHGAAYGIHVGTEQSAHEALNARIGKPLEGRWDGTREYGRTLLSPSQRTGTERGNGQGEGYYPSGRATYSNGDPVPMDARPNVFPVRITGPMINHPAAPVEDEYANSRMHGQITRGRARRGYFYRNIAEDEGSISAVVPSAAHLERVRPSKEAARHEPSAGIFGPTTGLDPRLFDEAGGLRPQVRGAVMERLDRCVRVDVQLAGSDWQKWLHVWLAGGSVSEWAGRRPGEQAQDLDVLVGLDLAAAQGYSSFEGMDRAQAATALNAAFRHCFNGQGVTLPGVAGTWDLTAYCNAAVNADITVIRPYAAYDVTGMRWAVRPPHLPEHTISDFDPAVIAEARAVAAEARAILRLPEPLRTREARSLWERIHAGRSQAFSDQGEGWTDPGNVADKWLQYAPHHVMDRIKALVFPVDRPLAKVAAASGPWYHGTHHRFKRGELITPGHPANDDLGAGGSGGSRSHVYAATNPEMAGLFAGEAVSAHPGSFPVIYEVQPTGPMEIDPELHEGGIDPEAYRSLHPLRVLREYRPVRTASVERPHPGPALHELAGHVDPDWASCYSPAEEVRRKTAAAQGYLRNPYHGTAEFGGRDEWSRTWFHGTKGEPNFGTRERGDQRELARPPEERTMSAGWTQPNQWLGVHFSPLYEVAHKFAGAGIASVPSSVVHARLRFSDPAHFEDEDHLSIAMAHWASQHYPHWHHDKLNERMAWNYGDQEGTHRDFSRVPGDPDQRYRLGHIAQSLFQKHPHMPEMIKGFSDNLREQGHHGITYGNGLEGPYITDATRGGGASLRYEKAYKGMRAGRPRSISAIALPGDIEVTRVDRVAPWRTEPKDGQRTWEDLSEHDEPDEMRDRVLAWHRQHGGRLPFKLAAKNKRPSKTKDQVNYRPATGAEHCGDCTMIRLLPPDFESHGCTLVKGLIDPGHVCDEWYPEKGRTAARETPDYDDPGKVYLRFGRWPASERSHNFAMGWDEEGVSAYDLDKNGDPMDPDPTGSARHHFHDESCEPDCDLDWMNENYGETSPADRVSRAERDRYNGRDSDSNTGHLVKGEFVGFGHDAEPLLNNVRRVGDWIDHRHLFINTARPHRLARDPSDEDYEEPEEKPPYGHRSRTAALGEKPPLRNPVTGGTEWYHGSDHPERFDRFDPRRERRAVEEGEADSWWNSRLGTHFTTEHDVAAEASEPMGGGNVYHVTLHMSRPRHYASENDLDKEAHGWARMHGFDLPADVLDHAGSLTSSPWAQQIADGFRHHLRSSGYDGITYGNEYEGTKGHLSAITFDPGQARIQSAHGTYEPWSHEAVSRTAALGASTRTSERFVTCDQGHRHWGALGAAGLLVRHRDGEAGPYRYLLQQRSKEVDHPGTWSTPGGALRPGETPEDGALREAREEGMRLPGDLRHHHTYSDDHGNWAYHTVVMDSPRRFSPDGSGESDWESEGHGWFTPQEVRGLDLHPGFSATWDKVRKSGAVARPAWDGSPLYHGSLTRFPPGTVLTPGDKDPEGSRWSGEYVYATTNPEAARYFGSMHDTSPDSDMDVHVHRVEPVGPVEPDEFPEGAEDERYAHGNYRARGLRVIDSRQLPGHWASVREAAGREGQLAEMDPRTRAAALAQEQVRVYHPLLARPLEAGHNEHSEVVSAWLRAAGHPRAGDAYVARHPRPEEMTSGNGRGPDGEPAVFLHPDRWDYGTAAHEAAHLITDHQTGRKFGEPYGPEGPHGPQWARTYAKLLDGISKGSAGHFMSLYKQHGPKPQPVPHREHGERQAPAPSLAGLVYLSVPPGTLHALPQGMQPKASTAEGEHHVTVAHLPRNMSDDEHEQVLKHAARAAAATPPLEGTLGGMETFPRGAGAEARRVAYVPADVPGIRELHGMLRPVNVSPHREFSPHVTVAYLRKGEDNPGPHPQVPVRFTHLHVERGGQVTSFPLTGRIEREAKVPRLDYDPADELPEGRGVWYRAHDMRYPLDEAHARSAPLNHGYRPFQVSPLWSVGQRGYSAFSSPHELSSYMDEMEWKDDPSWPHRKAIAFHGKHVGVGEDNEPLVVPQANQHCCGRVIHTEMPWDEFEGKLWHPHGEDYSDPESHKYHNAQELWREKNQGHELSERRLRYQYWSPPAKRSERRHEEKEDRRARQREAATGYDLKPRSAMIYLDLPPGIVRPVPGGVSEHHITLVYLGSGVTDEAFEEACRRTQQAAARHAPMDGVLRGIDIFPPSKSSDGKVVAFVPAYVGGIGALRRELEDLSASEHADYKPHVTLAYLTEGDSLPAPHPAVPLRVTRVHVKRGDDVVSYPLTGQIRKGASYEDATDEARERRRQRADRYLGEHENRGMTMSVPGKWAEQAFNSHIHQIIRDHSGGDFPDEHWEHLPDQEVSLRQKIHQHQGFVYPEAVRDKIREDFDDDFWPDDYREHEPGGSDPKFVVHEGNTYLLDGHHRFARARLMGHSSMWGKVFDTSNPDHDPRNCYECDRGPQYDDEGDEDGEWDDDGNWHQR